MSYLPKGRPTNFKLGTGSEYDDLQHQHLRRPERSKVNVIRSCRQSDACLPIAGQREVAETPKLAVRLSVPRVTRCASTEVKRSKVKVTRSLWVVVQVINCKGLGHFGGRTAGRRACYSSKNSK